MGNCFSTEGFSEGDLAILELVTVKRRYPLVKINVVPYLVDAVYKYFEEARKRGCAVDEEFKRHVAERIKSLLVKHGVDLSTMSARDLHGINNKDVLDVLKALGLGATANVAPSVHAERREEASGHGQSPVATPEKPQFCAPSRGDFAILELIEKKRRYHLVEINVVPYLVEAVHEYFKEAKEHGCVVDGRLKRYVAERIRSLLVKHGINLSTESVYDLHGINEDVLDVLKMLGLEQAPPPRPAAAPYLPVSKPRAPARAPPSPPPPPPSAKPIPPPPMPPRGYKPPRRRSRIKSALAKPRGYSTSTTGRRAMGALRAVALTIALGIALAVVLSHTATHKAPTFANMLDDPAVRAAFEALNRYRAENGVPPVEFIQLKTPLFRVEYIYNHSHLSHYDVEGRHPIYYYTLLDGGVYAVEEDLGLCVNCERDVSKVAERLIYKMVYDDALSFWGHRDSLLDPCNNRVSIAVAYDSRKLYIAVYMVGVWADWIEPPRYHNGTFSFKGYVYLPPRDDFYEVFIYRDVPTLANYHIRHSYSLGEPYAAVLPPDYRGQYRNVTNIRADRYVLRREGDRWYVDVAFRFEPPDGALYTVVMYANSTGVKWEPKSPSSRLYRCKVFTYTIGK